MSYTKTIWENDITPLSASNLNKIEDQIEQNTEALSVDYIVGQGTEGIWTYRKWNSGIAECWGQTAVKTYACTTQSGNLWYTSDTFNLPTGLFTSVNAAFSNRAPGTGSTPYNTLVTISGRTLSNTQFGIWVYTPQSTSQSLSITLYVIGRWKV